MEPELIDFTQLVKAQLMLLRMLSRSRTPHVFVMRRLIDLFVNSVAEVLDATHPFIREGIMETIDISGSYENFLEMNIWWDIYRMPKSWRQTQSGRFCLASMMDTVYKSYLWRSNRYPE